MIIVQFIKVFFSVYKYTKTWVTNWGVAIIKAEKKGGNLCEENFHRYSNQKIKL